MTRQLKYFFITWGILFVIILNYSLYIIDKSYIYIFVLSVLAPLVPSLIIYFVISLLEKGK